MSSLVEELEAATGKCIRGFCPNWKDVYKKQARYRDLVDYLKTKNLVMLSESLLPNKEKYLVKCNVCGFECKATIDNLKRKNRSCPKCSGKIKKTIEDCISLAISKNGKCLSISYINNYSPITWQCEYGHIWESSYNAVSTGSWCYYCGRILTSKKLVNYHAGKSKKNPRAIEQPIYGEKG